jgi:TetR/AcrR family transcriptional regulator, lmrAB and yxaGH operons repressor
VKRRGVFNRPAFRYLWTELSVQDRIAVPAALASRDEVVDRLLTSFRRNGYDGASLADLSKVSGLGRSSLYHYFPGGKEDMARAVLDRVDAWLDAAVIAPLQESGTPRERLSRMVAALDAFYDGGRERCILGAFVIGDGLEIFAPSLAAVFERWIGALAALAREAGVSPGNARTRAEKVVILVQGAVVLSAASGDPKPFQRTLRSLEAELLDL